MYSNGWRPTVTTKNGKWTDTGTRDIMKSDNHNIKYWSGHGLSNGSMSYFLSDDGDRSNNNYTNYSSASQMHKTYVKKNWDGDLDWVVLASCNQLTNSSNREDWADTMKGSSRKVKGIMGYGKGGLAPDGVDTSIAEDFVDLCFNSKYKRVLFAWLQANASNNVYFAGCLYHEVNEGDTLTDVSKVSSDSEIKYMQISKSGYSTDTDPFSITHRATNETPKIVKEIALDNATSINDNIILSRRINYEIDDIMEMKECVEKELIKENILPKDATLEEIVKIEKMDLDEENKKTLGYMLNYSHRFNGIKLSTTKDGDYIKVFVEDDNIVSILRQWSDIKYIESKNNITPISKKHAEEKALLYYDRTEQKVLSSKVAESNANLVYIRSNDNNSLIPACEYSTEDGSILSIVNALNGEVLR